MTAAHQERLMGRLQENILQQAARGRTTPFSPLEFERAGIGAGPEVAIALVQLVREGVLTGAYSASCGHGHDVFGRRDIPREGLLAMPPVCERCGIDEPTNPSPHDEWRVFLRFRPTEASLEGATPE